MPRSATAAREALVAQAERLFAERGIEGVSLRDVSAAAGQRNHSAAQYHFGDRAGLVRAVYDARMVAVNERRERHLLVIEDAGRLGDPGALVEAVVVPLVDVVTAIDSWYARFLVRARWEPLAIRVVAELPAADPMRAVSTHLLRALAPLPRDVRRSRVDQLHTLVIGTLAGWEWSRDNGDRHLPVHVLTDELVATGVAVVTAPRSASSAVTVAAAVAVAANTS